MSGDSQVAGSFVVEDYVVFAAMLLVSAAVGVYYAWADRAQRSSGDFLMGGRRLTALPVSMSLTASFMSAITVLSNPAEVYRYGASIGYYGLSYVMTMVVTSEVFLPVFYRLAITSTYEILYTGIVIYAPALALNQVTGMNLWGAVISTGVVCTFYCTMGGLKAVVWTDVFQLGVMLAGFLSVIIKSVVIQGGVFPIISDSQQGGRLNFLDFDTNPLRRHTFWTITIGGTFVWVSIYGINQAQVQRYISCKSIIHARLSLYINLVGLWSILLCSVFAGLCLFSVYKHCDPWTAGLVSAPDQLMPYLVMDILKDYPGLPGLFVAAAYSGSLSTVSSSINALAAVTVEDLIKPYTNLSEKHLSWTSKGLSLMYGVLCIGMAGLASLMGGILQFLQDEGIDAMDWPARSPDLNPIEHIWDIMSRSIHQRHVAPQTVQELADALVQAVISIFGVIGGPLLGLFTLGVLCPFANSKGALSGLVSGLVVSLWVGIGAQINPPPPELTRPLSLTTEGCNFTTTGNLNWTSTALPTEPTSITAAPSHNIDGIPLLADNWYSLSYLYFSPVGTIIAISVGLLVSLFTGTLTSQQEHFVFFVYCYGAIFIYFGISYILTMGVISEVFLPVFHRLSITSAYEYLELRFNRATRLVGTLLFTIYTILYTGIIIYGPALALSQVTDMDLWSGVISTGLVCTLYCTLGGLKAVVWTDVFQFGIMISGYLSVVIKSVITQGGVATIISDSQRGGRLNFWDFDINPLRRHTFWTIIIGGMCGWLIVYGTNQSQVQRYVSCKSITQARLAVYISLLGLCSFLLCSVFAGMCLYSVYKNCDPWTAGLVSTPDQLMPYLIMDILTGYPGLPGLFLAAVYSGSLSTVSSSINALAAVTMEDLIKPYTNMSEKHLYWMSKGLSFLYGVLCITMAGLASVLGGMMQAGVIISGVLGGPLLGIFIMGILCSFVNAKVMGRTGRLNMPESEEKQVGSTNPAFCDTEMN
ncbi:hypothetical protein L3Q82_009527 [Scortum barcoo]|uniref:Uncharacterized protein n=1 Tax=Scortum barcoo TaxID=214431 RepID=A0ACB8WGQ6_9TELE|nr:hypothetical protein L3Q82_009527 [Scortum barcoo]